VRQTRKKLDASLGCDIVDALINSRMSHSPTFMSIPDQKISEERYPPDLPRSDRAAWDLMAPSQRERAAKRVAAFKAWSDGELGVSDAVKLSGLSRSRFYRLAADWREAPGLKALSAAVGSGSAGSRLDPRAVNALQAVVAKVVRYNKGATVSQLVRLMVETANIPEGAELPGDTRLRRIVEDELRRVAGLGEAGGEVRFDCTAVNLPQADGRPHIMFTCLDKGTRAILGYSVHSTTDVAVGYGKAAADALERIQAGLAVLPWALRTKQMIFTAGTDTAKSIALVERLLAAGVQGSVQLTQLPKRFGRYYRELVGTRLGRIEITPARTAEGPAMPDAGDMTPWSAADAAAAIGVIVEQHNAGITSSLSEGRGGRVPEDLQLALRVLAESNA
jgi:hypothetical protein